MVNLENLDMRFNFQLHYLDKSPYVHGWFSCNYCGSNMSCGARPTQGGAGFVTCAGQQRARLLRVECTLIRQAYRWPTGPHGTGSRGRGSFVECTLNKFES